MYAALPSSEKRLQRRRLQINKMKMEEDYKVRARRVNKMPQRSKQDHYWNTLTNKSTDGRRLQS